MNYTLSDKNDKQSAWQSAKGIAVYVKGDWPKIALALFFVLINSGITVLGPYLIGDTADKYIRVADVEGLTRAILQLLGLYSIGFIANYIQIILMGGVGQSILFRLRNAIFEKVQSLPLAFFNVNKSGDLISRINSDTDKLNQAFSEVLLRFIGQIFIIIGVAIIMFLLNWQFASSVVAIALALAFITYAISPWVRKRNKASLDALGALSGNVQEGLSNFKVMLAFGRRDYLLSEFEQKNDVNMRAATKSSIANGILTPLYDFGANLANLLVVILGIYFVINGKFTFGVLLSFILYTDRLFQPLRIMAQLFTSMQTSIAAWSRINSILKLKSNLPVLAKTKQIDQKKSDYIVELRKVDFAYSKDAKVLHDINLKLEPGKTYAIVGPTGGGKSTLASIIARLYDATTGEVLLKGKDIKQYSQVELSSIIGFILQEPFLFAGTVAANIMYANPNLANANKENIEQMLKENNLDKVIARFNDGLDTVIGNDAENISLGQKQLVAFVRAMLRKPELLILDEATANIDTVTEDTLEQIIAALPASTTKIIIAHRLNTIKNADEIFFIAGGKLVKASNFDNAMHLINTG